MDNELQRAMKVLRQGGLQQLDTVELHWLIEAAQKEFDRRAHERPYMRSAESLSHDVHKLRDAESVPAYRPGAGHYDRNALRDLLMLSKEGLVGLQSTDEPLGSELGQRIACEHDRLLCQIKEIDAELQRGPYERSQ